MSAYNLLIILIIMIKVVFILLKLVAFYNRVMGIKDTLFSLNLRKKHACAIIDDTPVTRGMLKKAQDYTTFGIVSEELIKELDGVTKNEKI